MQGRNKQVYKVLYILQVVITQTHLITYIIKHISLIHLCTTTRLVLSYFVHLIKKCMHSFPISRFLISDFQISHSWFYNYPLATQFSQKQSREQWYCYCSHDRF